MTKISDLMRTGAALRPPSALPRLFSLEDNVVCSCALGAAYEAKTGHAPSYDEVKKAMLHSGRQPVSMDMAIVALELGEQKKPGQNTYNLSERMTLEQAKLVYATAGLDAHSQMVYLEGNLPAVYEVAYRINDVFVTCKREGDPRLATADALEAAGF